MMWFLRFMVILSVPFTAMYAQALTRADQLIVLGGTSSATGSTVITGCAEPFRARLQQFLRLDSAGMGTVR